MPLLPFERERDYVTNSLYYTSVCVCVCVHTHPHPEMCADKTILLMLSVHPSINKTKTSLYQAKPLCKPIMALLLPLLLPILLFIGGSDGAWCVCKTDLSDSALQKTLDYACGAGADCNPIIQNGPCYSPNSVKAHCNYAVNSYYQRKGQAQGSCDFSGTATTTSSDPSSNGCSYPSSASNAGTSTTPSSTGNQGSSSTPGTGGTLTPSTGGTGGTGGVIGGLGPSGSSVSPDYSEGGFVLQAGMISLFLCITILFFLLGFD